jgi:hypothetical protein
MPIHRRDAPYTCKHAQDQIGEKWLLIGRHGRVVATTRMDGRVLIEKWNTEAATQALLDQRYTPE